MAVHRGFAPPSPTLPTSPVEIPARGSSEMIEAPSSSTKKHETASMQCTKRDTVQTLCMVGLVRQYRTFKDGRAPEPSLRNAVVKRHPVSEKRLTCAVSLFLQVWEAGSLTSRLSPQWRALEWDQEGCFIVSFCACRYFARTQPLEAWRVSLYHNTTLLVQYQTVPRFCGIQSLDWTVHVASGGLAQSRNQC